MRFNEKALCDLSKGSCDLEGRLNFKKHHNNASGSVISSSGFKERWFKLKYNLLFYFKTNDFGQIEQGQPAGVFVLENSSIYQESSAGAPFAFSLVFKDDPDKRYIISTRSEQDVRIWIAALKKNSYEYLRSQLVLLQDKIKKLTGNDPLLLVPRNKPVRYNTSKSREEFSEDIFSSSSTSYSFKSHIKVTSNESSARSTYNTISIQKQEINNVFKNSTSSSNNIDNIIVHNVLSESNSSDNDTFKQESHSKSKFYTNNTSSMSNNIPVDKLIDI